MNARLSASQQNRRLSMMLPAVVTALAFPVSAFGAERMVLGEYFTWNQCSACTSSGPLVSDMIDDYEGNGRGTLAVVQYHLWDQYEEPWGASRGQTFYGAIFNGTPFFAYDGLFDAWPIGTYVSKFLNQQAVPTPVTISVGVEEDETSADTYNVTVRTCLEPTATPLNLRIYTVVAEDAYPSSPSYSRNTFRTAMPTRNVNLEPGGCIAETQEVTVASVGLTARYLKFIAWAQEPNASWPADVYQAGMGVFPWKALPETGDFDNDGDVDLNDYAAFAECASGPNPASPPAAACRAAFDPDKDGDVDHQDYSEFMINFTVSR
jgi:hypothetical protein